jgi:uncharacterized membrane protein YfcA
LSDVGSIVALVLANAAMAFGAAAQAGIGMGLNLFTIPILALIDPVYVPGPVLVHSLLISILASYRLRADIDRRELAISVAGLLAGTAAAAVALAQINLQNLPRVFGALVLVAVLISVAGLHIRATTPNIVAASVVAGMMGTIAGAHGPPIALIYQREAPTRIRSALLPFFMFANAISIVALAIIGLFGLREIYASVLLVPGLVAGFLASSWLIRAMTPATIRACILAISAISGFALLIKS